MPLTSVLQLLGGVGLFLFGIKLMSETLQDLSGEKLRRLFATVTKTPVRGIGVGILVTTLLQSSSACTVMTVSFVHAGLMSLYQAFGVIMGANIGTTVTAQLIAFKFSDFALPLIGIGVLLSMFGRSKRQRSVGNGLVGFGLLFLGMKTMEGSMSFLRGRKDIFLAFSNHPLLGVLAGTGLTLLVQSSAATVGLVIAMASQGLLGLDAGIPIILGDNIGTTITAVLASIGANRGAKQAAACHVLFNLIGVVIFMTAFPLFRGAVQASAASIPRQLANSHTFFNVANTLLFLPFSRPFVALIQKIIPGKVAVLDMGPRFLDRRLITATPAAAVHAVRQELVRLGFLAEEMLQNVHAAFVEKDPKKAEEVFQTEKLVNQLTHGIARYAAEVGQASLSEDLSLTLGAYVNGASDIERVGDHATNLTELFEYTQENHLVFSEKAMAEFEEMFTNARLAFHLAIESILNEDGEAAKEVLVLEDRVDALEKELRRKHIERLNTGACQPSAGVVFIDILSNLERIADHGNNLALMVLDVIKMDTEGKRIHDGKVAVAGNPAGAD
ncbi:MAG: Na/Pi cotransporter family protein [Synergistaceae bacterium]|nr:Na/Pi cotransporter family protein [Synergistaceae bacterium]